MKKLFSAVLNTTCSFLIFSVIIGALFLTSCNDSSTTGELPEKEENYATLNFSLSPFNYSIEASSYQPQTRATTIKTFNKLDVYLYTVNENGEYELYDYVQQGITTTDGNGNTIDNPNYGNFTFRVIYGEYKVLALGYYYSEFATVNGPQDISFTDNKVPVTFFAWQDLSVDASTVSVPVTLEPAVARLIVTATATLPEDVKFYRFTINPTGINFDAINAKATETGERVLYTDLSSKVGQTNTSANCCLYLTAEELTSSTSNITVVFDALAEDYSVLYTHTFENVPFKRGYTSSYKGPFFGNDALGFTLTANYEWKDYFENGYSEF